MGAGKPLEGERVPSTILRVETADPTREELLESARRSLLISFGREILNSDVFRLKSSELLDETLLSNEEKHLLAEIEGTEYARMSDAVLEFVERTVQRLYALPASVRIDRNRLVLRLDELREENTQRVPPQKTEAFMPEAAKDERNNGRGWKGAILVLGLVAGVALGWGLYAAHVRDCKKVCALSNERAGIPPSSNIKGDNP